MGGGGGALRLDDMEKENAELRVELCAFDSEFWDELEELVGGWLGWGAVARRVGDGCTRWGLAGPAWRWCRASLNSASSRLCHGRQQPSHARPRLTCAPQHTQKLERHRLGQQCAEQAAAIQGLQAELAAARLAALR